MAKLVARMPAIMNTRDVKQRFSDTIRHGRPPAIHSEVDFGGPRGLHLSGGGPITSTERSPNLDSLGMPRDRIVMGTTGARSLESGTCLGRIDRLKFAAMATYEHA